MIHVGHFIDHLVDHHDGHLVHFHTETHTVSNRQIQTHTDRHTQTDPWTLDTETLECRHSRPSINHKYIHTHKHCTNKKSFERQAQTQIYKSQSRHTIIVLSKDVLNPVPSVW